MDGTAATFLLSSPFLSSVGDCDTGGILYVEDFDSPTSCEVTEDIIQSAAELSNSPITPADLEAARDAGRVEGMRGALTDAHLLQTQLHGAATLSLADALRTQRKTLEHLASRHAIEGVKAMIAILQAAIPSTMARHAACEVETIARSLLPALAYEPELQVRVNPNLVETLRETIAECVSADVIAFSVASDSMLGAGDVQIAWRDGQAQRCCASTWNEIRATLVPLGLPSLEDVCIVN